MTLLTYADLTLLRLQALQKRHNVTRQQFADRVGVTKMTTGRWLSGARSPSLEWLGKILHSFDETPESFEDLDPSEDVDAG